MTPEAVFLLIGCLLGLFGILAIAIGVIAAILIGEGEIKLTDTPILLKDTKVPLGGEREVEEAHHAADHRMTSTDARNDR